ncbi:MAG: hypothetical protein RLY87_366 [Chloroflexota bacterium]|jgi:ubiquinone/menaquinone biosynthesis C-methylase UbiE
MTLRAQQNHFATVANQYAAFRPTYPTTLITDVVARAGGPTSIALDVAAGNGQATVPLAAACQHVYASDLALTQIAAMPRIANVSAYVSRAEQTCLPDQSIDIVCVAQAMHWFDVDAFHREVRRIGKPGGVIAVWTYALLRATPAITAIIDELYAETATHWPADRVHVDNHYATLAFPYERIPYSPPAMTAAFTQERLRGYLSTWSGVQRYIKAGHPDPVAARADAFAAAWGQAADTSVTFTFDLTVLLGRL